MDMLGQKAGRDAPVSQGIAGTLECQLTATIDYFSHFSYLSLYLFM